MSDAAVIDARDVRVQFGEGDAALQAVNGVSLEVARGRDPRPGG